MGDAVHNDAPFKDGKTNAKSPAGVQSVQGGIGLPPVLPGGDSGEPQLATRMGKSAQAKRNRVMNKHLHEQAYRVLVDSGMTQIVERKNERMREYAHSRSEKQNLHLARRNGHSWAIRIVLNGNAG